jgi:hypothetical protein
LWKIKARVKTYLAYDVGLFFVGESIVGVGVIYYKDTVVLTTSKHHHIYILNMEMGSAANRHLLLARTGT